MKTVLVISGGSSLEHNVSLLSGYSVSKAILELNYNLISLCITKNNIWKYSSLPNILFQNPNNINKISINLSCPTLKNINQLNFDIVFITMHGKYGEDGKIQGFLEMNNINYIGCDLNTSILCIDKHLTKLLANSIGIKIVDFKVFYKWDKINKKEIFATLGNDIIIKIANGGSSFGVYKTNLLNFDQNLKKAFLLDNKIIIEKYCHSTEVCLGILGKNSNYELGDIKYMNSNGVFDFNNKYVLNNSKINFNLSNQVRIIINEITLKLAKLINIKDFARFDYFIDKANKVYLNEINTIPGLIYKKSTFASSFESKYNYNQLINNIINSVE